MQLKIPHFNKTPLPPHLETSLFTTHGDNINQPHDRTTTRIAFQNIRGIDRTEPAAELINVIQDYEIDIFGASETNCDWTPEFVYRTEAILQKTFGNTLLSSSSAKFLNKTGYLPGGVCQISKGKIVGRHPTTGSDTMGRYAWQTFSGSNTKKICIITAYRVSQNKGFKSPASTDITAHKQQVEALLKRGFLDPDPKRQFLLDMKQFIHKQQRSGHEIILMLDANESMDHQTDLQQFARDTGLQDIHRYHHTNLPATTRMGSSKPIDFILASDGIIDHITACGHLAFHEGCISDHIMLWADVDFKRFFGGSGPQIVRPAAREFKYNNTRLREKFLDELEQLFQHQQIEKRILQLTASLQRLGATPDLIAEYNRIDRDIVRCIKGAASKTVRKNYGYHRSPALSEAGLEVLYWRMVLGCKSNDIPASDRLSKVASRMERDSTTDINLPINKIHSAISNARRTLRQAQDNAPELRQQWLKGVARTKDAEDDSAAAREIKEMVRQMHTAAMHQKLTRITKGSRGGLDYIEIPTHDWYYTPTLNELYHYDQGLFECHVSQDNSTSNFHPHSSLKVPPTDLLQVTVYVTPNNISIASLSDTQITWRKVTKKEEMETIIMQRNKKHLQQVAMEEAPPTQPEFSRFFEEHGCCELSDKLLDGDLTTELDAFPEMVQNWFRTLQRTDQEKACPSIDGWITQKEFQTAFHMTKERTSSSPSGIHYTFWKCISINDHLSSFLPTMMSLPFVYGFVNDRWTRSIDVMLEKSKGVRKIHRLRIIGLVEGDFNTALKLFFAKKLISNAESTDLTEEQWARPNRTAMDPALRKMLGFEYSRVMYVTLVFFANDATACFDRMVPDISSIIARKYGVSKNIMRCRNEVLRLLKRGVRTLHGDSKQTYSQMALDLAILGEYQGKADAAPIWSVESHTFLKTHRMLAEGAFMPHVIDKVLAIRKNNDAYVDDDDMTLTKTGSDFKTVALKLIPQAEKSAQLWNDILFLSGAGVAHHKSMWQGIAFDGTKCPPTILSHMPGDIHLRDRKGVPTKIKQQSSNHPNKGLGCHLAPTSAQSGSQHHEFEVREKEATNIINNVRPHKLSVTETHLLLSGRIMKSVGYSAPVTQFTEKQNARLNTIVNEELLPRAKWNRHTAHKIIYSPLCLGGGAWPSFQINQDTESILTMIKHFRWNGTVGQDMLVVLSAWQLASGLCTPLMESTEIKLPYLGAGWFTHVRSRLATMQAQIWIEKQWTPSLQRRHDQAIMLAFLSIPNITKSQLELLNYVRMYLRVITIAELATEKGSIIPGHRFSGRWQASSVLHWPDIPAPPPKALSFFRNKIKQIFGTSSSGSRRHNAVHLATELGPWYTTPRHIQHASYRTENAVFRRVLDGVGYTIYTKLTSTLFKESHHTNTLPSNTIPVTIGHRENTVWTNDKYSLIYNMPSQDTIREYRRPSEHPPLAGSGGSVDIIDGSSAAAYRVFTGKEEIAGDERLPDSDYATSFRAELHGEYLTTKCIKENVTAPVDQICDNQRAVEVITKPLTNPTRMLDPEMDLILAIKHLRKCTKTPSNPQWIRGHSDDKKASHELSDKENLNITVDRVSGNSRKHGHPTKRRPLPGSGAMLIIKDKWVTTAYREQIHRAVMEPGHRKFFTHKFSMTHTVYDTISWRFIGYARRNLNHTMNTRISKYMYHWSNTGYQKGLMGQVNICPCCGSQEETQLHMFQCQNVAVVRTVNECIQSFTDHLTQRRLPLPIIHLLRDIITSTFSNTTPSKPDHPILQQVYNDQRAIGFELLTRGFIAKSWLEGIRHFTKDKTDQKLKAILLGLWHQIMAPVWDCRNNILHQKDNIVTHHEHKQLDSELYPIGNS